MAKVNHSFEDAERIVACVNAMEGLNPSAVPEMEPALRWIRQTVHQAYHQGSVEECGKNTCSYITALLAKVITRAEGRS